MFQPRWCQDYISDILGYRVCRILCIFVYATTSDSGKRERSLNIVRASFHRLFAIR
jgi:hypothetical protein